jgi:hypothetical protein
MKIDKDVKRFFNNLRCPLCNGQLDGNIHINASNLYCINNQNEYIINILPFQNYPIYESITHSYLHYEYNIVINMVGNGVFNTKINRYDLTYTKFSRNKSKLCLLDVNVRIDIFRSKISEEDLLEKIGVYNTFS